ncbi:MAG: hypothetical protein Kow0074_01180 [Candidatus Zixiibacteriota bacterium]
MNTCRLSIVVFLCALCVVAGCAKDPFSTRQPEDPVGAKGTYITPIDPLIGLENLRYAMIEQNIGHYRQTYSESLVFTFDFLLVDRPDSASGWDSIEEDRIVGNLLADADSIALVWDLTEGRSDRFDDSTAYLYRTYDITVDRDSAGVVVSRAYQGEFIIRMARNALDLWSIVAWEDLHLSATQPSWADLKSSYR